MVNINDLIRTGTVSSINSEKASARVLFEDRDNLVTAELKILFKRTLGTQDYNMVKVGEQVTCLFLPNGVEEGFIIGSYYTDKITPPANDEKKRMIKFDDGSIVEYDDGEFTIKATKNINVLAAQSVNIEAPMGVNINGDVQVNGSINASGSIIDSAENTSNHSH